MRKCDVGGQAIIEGVMMRGSKGLATAIRTPNGKIEVKVKKTKPITKKYKILNIPIIRGAATLIDSLMIGINTLNYSASFFEEDEKESKFDIWLKFNHYNNYDVFSSCCCRFVFRSTNSNSIII